MICEHIPTDLQELGSVAKSINLPHRPHQAVDGSKEIFQNDYGLSQFKIPDWRSGCKKLDKIHSMGIKEITSL